MFLKDLGSLNTDALNSYLPRFCNLTHNLVTGQDQALLKTYLQKVLEETEKMYIYELWKTEAASRKEENEQADRKRQRDEADTDTERFKRRLNNLESLKDQIVMKRSSNHERVQKIIIDLLEIDEKFLGDKDYKEREEELKKGYETMYSADKINEKIEEVNEQLKEVQTKYPKLS